MMPRALRFALVSSFVVAAACTGGAPNNNPSAVQPVPTKTEPQTVAVAAAPSPPEVVPQQEQQQPTDPNAALRTWLSAHLPDGGAIVEGDGPMGVVHTAREGDTLPKIAAAYLDLTTAYTNGELGNAILRENPKLPKNGTVPVGSSVRIPHVVTEAPKPPSEARLGWPEDKSMRGIYMNATMMGAGNFPQVLDQLVAHGMNAIVVDAKDVTGWFTYPTKIPLALSIDANKHVAISSLERLVRVAHAHGIRVISRVACFRDEHMGPKRGDLAIQSRAGGPHRAPSHIVDWLDPANETVQQYLLDVVKESLEAGVDEIQLDYVRFPTEGVYDADFHLTERKVTTEDVITAFVGRVHEETKAAQVPLSLDVFGCVAWQFKKDMDSTGQDLRRLGLEVEALSPMVYPSHFGVGFHGYEVPGDHPDIVAIGTKQAIDTLKGAGAEGVVVRPWVQAFPFRTPHFGAPYVADQIKEAKNGGGVGFLAWNSGGEYGATFAAVPLVKKAAK